MCVCAYTRAAANASRLLDTVSTVAVVGLCGYLKLSFLSSTISEKQNCETIKLRIIRMYMYTYRCMPTRPHLDIGPNHL